MENKNAGQLIAEAILSILAAIGILTLATAIEGAIVKERKRSERIEKLQDLKEELGKLKEELEAETKKEKELIKIFNKLSENDIDEEDGISTLKGILAEETKEEAKEVLENIIEVKIQIAEVTEKVIKVVDKTFKITK